MTGRGSGGRAWRDILERRQRLRMALGWTRVAMVVLAWLAVSGLAVWAYVFVFGQAPPDLLFLAVFEVVGAVIVAVLGARRPLLPAPGEHPELTAADAFLRGRRKTSPGEAEP